MHEFICLEIFELFLGFMLEPDGFDWTGSDPVQKAYYMMNLPFVFNDWWGPLLAFSFCSWLFFFYNAPP